MGTQNVLRSLQHQRAIPGHISRVMTIFCDNRIVARDGMDPRNSKIDVVVFRGCKRSIEATYALQNGTPVHYCGVHSDVVSPEQFHVMTVLN